MLSFVSFWRRQFDEVDVALAPAVARLDEIARPQLIGEVEILIMLEVAVALEQPEALDVTVEKGRHLRAWPDCATAARSIPRCRNG